MSNGSQFYVNSRLETVVDPYGPPVVQNQLLDELHKCDKLVQLDWRYAKIVQGASKMPWNMVWAARNQDDPLSDTDLAELKNMAWNEVIKKRYLPSVPGTLTVGETTASMLEIMREMNLQRRRFQIMGLHEQVEACEIHLVLQLCQAGILRSDRYRVMANRFRRHEKLFEAFGLAVGAFVCASAPFTLGAAMARYERDLQYEYKKNVTALFVWALQQNMSGIDAAALLDEDYVARIARLIIVWPDEDSKKGKRIGFPKKTKKDGDDDDDDNGDLRNMMLSSIGVAQNDADKARAGVIQLTERVDYGEKLWEKELGTHRTEVGKEIDALELKTENGLRGHVTNVEMILAKNFTETKDRVHGDVMNQVEIRFGRISTQNEIHSAGINRRIQDLETGLRSVQLGPVGPVGVPAVYDDAWKRQIDARMDSVVGGVGAFVETVPGLVATATQDRITQIEQYVENGSKAMEARMTVESDRKLDILQKELDALKDKIKDNGTQSAEASTRQLDGLKTGILQEAQTNLERALTNAKVLSDAYNTGLNARLDELKKNLKASDDKIADNFEYHTKGIGECDELIRTTKEELSNQIDTEVIVKLTDIKKEIDDLKESTAGLQEILQELLGNNDHSIFTVEPDIDPEQPPMGGASPGTKRNRHEGPSGSERSQYIPSNVDTAAVVRRVLQELNLKAEIIAETKQLIEARIIQTRAAQPMGVSDQAAMDTTGFEARIAALEELFMEVTDTTRSPFTRPVPPARGDFGP